MSRTSDRNSRSSLYLKMIYNNFLIRFQISSKGTIIGLSLLLSHALLKIFDQENVVVVKSDDDVKFDEDHITKCRRWEWHQREKKEDKSEKWIKCSLPT